MRYWNVIGRSTTGSPALAIEIENKVRESLGIPPVQSAIESVDSTGKAEKAGKPEKAAKTPA